MKSRFTYPAAFLATALVLAISLSIARAGEVTATTDDGAGSLRQQVLATEAAGTITFAQALDGSTISLSTGQLLIGKNLTIDASMLPNGITIDAGGNSRVFKVESGAIATFLAFTITGGRTADGANGTSPPSFGPGTPGVASAPGGGIYNAGELTLDGITLHDCATGNGGIGGNGSLGGAGGSGGSSGDGGGIYNEGTLTVNNSTIVDNQTGNGGNSGSGGIFQIGGRGGSGGGIYNSGTLTLDHATITGNVTGPSGSSTLPLASPEGGGVFDAAELTIQNTVIAENSSVGGPDLFGSVENRSSVNFIGDPDGATGLGTLDTDYLTGDPQLGGLRDHGGPTMTRAPLGGSPLVDAGDILTLDRDQRGAARPSGSSVDIGAVETFIAYVKLNADGSDDGTSWANAYPDLQSALTADPSPSQIWVAQGTYYPDITGDTDSDSRGDSFHLKSGVALYGGFPNTGTPTLADRDPTTHSTILSGDIDQNDGDDFANNAYHVLIGSDTDATAILDGFTITAGNANEVNFPNSSGGGLYSDSGSPSLTNCSFLGNRSSESGGGIYNTNSSSPSLTNCSFQGNRSSESGGGIYNTNSSSPSLTNCSFQGNSAGFGGGGGILNTDSSSPTLTNCSFQGNNASNGGGIYNTDSSSSSLTNCSFQGNNASSGGGIYNRDSSSPSLTNCSFQGNNASTWGGGIYNVNSSPSLTNCSFQGNNTSNWGGGIFNTTSSSPSLTNCSFQGNSAEFGGGIYNYASSPSLTNCSFQGNSAEFGGGIYNYGSPPSLTNCIIWNNAENGDTTAPGASVANANNSSPSYSHCLIEHWADGGINDLGDNTNLNGTNPANDPLFVDPVNPNDAPTTGGDLRLREGSPALNAGDDDPSLNVTETDLPGNPRRVGVIDLGAYEGAVSPSEYLPLLWDTDRDGDGSSYGLELALDTEPDVWNPRPLGNFTTDSNGDPAFFFSRNSDPAGDYILKLMRSPDLTPGSFTEIFSITSTGGGTGTEAENNIVVAGDDVILTDVDPPAGDAFYRLEAEYVAP